MKQPKINKDNLINMKSNFNKYKILLTTMMLMEAMTHEVQASAMPKFLAEKFANPKTNHSSRVLTNLQTMHNAQKTQKPYKHPDTQAENNENEDTENTNIANVMPDIVIAARKPGRAKQREQSNFPEKGGLFAMPFEENNENSVPNKPNRNLRSQKLDIMGAISEIPKLSSKPFELHGSSASNALMPNNHNIVKENLSNLRLFARKFEEDQKLEPLYAKLWQDELVRLYASDKIDLKSMTQRELEAFRVNIIKLKEVYSLYQSEYSNLVPIIIKKIASYKSPEEIREERLLKSEKNVLARKRRAALKAKWNDARSKLTKDESKAMQERIKQLNNETVASVTLEVPSSIEKLPYDPEKSLAIANNVYRYFSANSWDQEKKYPVEIIRYNSRLRDAMEDATTEDLQQSMRILQEYQNELASQDDIDKFQQGFDNLRNEIRFRKQRGKYALCSENSNPESDLSKLFEERKPNQEKSQKNNESQKQIIEPKIDTSEIEFSYINPIYARSLTKQVTESKNPANSENTMEMEDYFEPSLFDEDYDDSQVIAHKEIIAESEQESEHNVNNNNSKKLLSQNKQQKTPVVISQQIEDDKVSKVNILSGAEIKHQEQQKIIRQQQNDNIMLSLAEQTAEEVSNYIDNNVIIAGVASGEKTSPLKRIWGNILFSNTKHKLSSAHQAKIYNQNYVLGLDLSNSDRCNFGVALTKVNSHIANTDSIVAQGVLGSFYGQYDLTPKIFISSILSYGKINFKINSTQEYYKANSNLFNAKLDLGSKYYYSNILFVPMLGVKYSSNKYSSKIKNENLNSSKRQQNFYLNAGLNISKLFELQKVDLTPEVLFRYSRKLNNKNIKVIENFEDSVENKVNLIDKNQGLVGVSLNISNRGKIDTKVGYNYGFSKKTKSHMGFVKIMINF